MLMVYVTSSVWPLRRSAVVRGGCPLTSGGGQRDDFGDQGFDLVFDAGGTVPAARAAGVGGDWGLPSGVSGSR
jgi:hypothetical protein